MGTIQARIEGRVGEAASGDDIVYTTTHMQDAYDHGLRAVIMTMPERAWKFFGKNRVDFLPLVGTPLLTNKIISVLRRDGTYYRACVMIDADMAGPAADSRSIHYASAFTPVCWVESGSFSNPMLKVLPEDGSKAARLVSLAIPTVDVTTDTIVPHFPDELEELPEIYTAAWIKQREAGYLRRSSQDELEAITSSGYLAAFEGDLPVFTPPTEPNMPSLTLVSMTTLPSLVLEAVPVFTDLDLTGITAPSAVLIYESAGAEPEDTLSVGTSLPTYTGPVFTYDQTTTILDALSSAKDMVDNSGIGGSTDVETLLAADLLDQARVGIDAANVELRRAQTAIQDEQAQLQDFSERLKEALGKFTGEANVYQADLAKEVATASADVQAYVAKMQDNKNVLDKQISQYNTDVQNYSAKVRAVTQEWQLEEVSFKLAKWAAQIQSATAAYSAQAGAYIQEYAQKNQALLGEYNAAVGAVIREYQALVQERIGEFQSNLSRATSRLQEAGVRLQTMQSFDQKSLAALR
ncbi:hypothetical protein LCGC14_2098290, partial [marine sediment metagenome]